MAPAVRRAAVRVAAAAAAIGPPPAAALPSAAALRRRSKPRLGRRRHCGLGGCRLVRSGLRRRLGLGFCRLGIRLRGERSCLRAHARSDRRGGRRV
eukprot:94502-Chlamydomonas_euryale.AAC.4